MTHITPIHADRTDCHHPGPAQASMHEDGGPRCSAGWQITHVRWGDKTLTIGETYHAVQSFADAFIKAITPMVEQVVKAMSGLTSEPMIQALAAAAAVTERERAREQGRLGRGPDRGRHGTRAVTGDPCGSGPAGTE